MRALVVLAHPEPQSLCGSLSKVIIQQLESDGHECRLSDLYGMKWKSQVDHDDFPLHPNANPLKVASASRRGYDAGSLTDDVKDEQKKLDWADAVILVFPLWWFTMPAILKGWVDRVFACGFAYGVGEHSDRRWGDRYGEGRLAGKRAMLVVTTGGWKQHYSERGINGSIDDLLFPIHHGILFYTGLDVLPPFVVHRADRMDEIVFMETAEQLRGRIRQWTATPPISYRPQNSGDYIIPSMVLKESESTSTRGFAIHLQEAPGGHASPEKKNV